MTSYFNLDKNFHSQVFAYLHQTSNFLHFPKVGQILEYPISHLFTYLFSPGLTLRISTWPTFDIYKEFLIVAIFVFKTVWLWDSDCFFHFLLTYLGIVLWIFFSYKLCSKEQMFALKFWRKWWKRIGNRSNFDDFRANNVFFPPVFSTMVYSRVTCQWPARKCSTGN